MFYGQHRHGIDEKGRIIFPAKFRELLGEKFYITVGLDSCLQVYPEGEWKQLEYKIKSLPMSSGGEIQRFFFTNTTDASFDKQGRVLIPSNLRAYAKLDKEVVIAGISNRLEIWDAGAFDSQSNVAAINPDDVAQKMLALGI